MIKYGWQGIVKVRDSEGERIIYNRIMNLALDELIKPFLATTADIEIKFLALGTSTTPVADNQTQLGAEIERVQYISRSRTGLGEATTVFLVKDDEGVGTIEEIGIFAGTTATAAANSGLMISRIPYHKVKTDQEEIQFTRIDRLVRG